MSHRYETKMTIYSSSASFSDIRGGAINEETSQVKRGSGRDDAGSSQRSDEMMTFWLTARPMLAAESRKVERYSSPENECIHMFGMYY